MATITQTQYTAPVIQQPPPPYTVTTNVVQPQPQPVLVQPAVMHSTMVVQQRAVMGKGPTTVICTNCRQNVVTRTTSSLKGEAWVLAAILCFLGGILCVWIPFVMDSMYRTSHYCPSCNAFQGNSV